MATGRLFAAGIPATTNTAVYTVPASKTGSLSLNLCNTTSAQIKVRIALAASGTPVDGEYIEYDTAIPANGVLERGVIVLAATQNVVIYAASVGINATGWGFEE